MRFLIVTMQNTPPPPDMALGLFEALSAWAKSNQEQGKIEQVWSFAGLPGGGGIANVNSLEELDALMTSFPMSPFSDIETYPLVDLEPSLENVRQAIRSMMPQG
jgi:muconolactone delta-isomerase